MKNPLEVLARMFSRASPNSFVTRVVMHAIGQPLLVHPAIGERIIGAYLEGSAESAPPVAAEAKPGQVAVLNISGGMVNRFTPGFCGPGPASYEGIRSAFKAALDDEQVSAIVLRLDSPGGMASGCFDLTDLIFASRDKKRIVAMVDDMAYSGAYALAAACGEIWVTRTAGVGSIGAVYYHFDQSEYDKKEGYKVTPIYSGAHKTDLSPHKPLGDDVRERAQASIDELRTMFAQSVARYRGLKLEAVMATEAACYNGPAGIKAGLADKLGTFADLMAELQKPKEAAAAPIAPAASATAADVGPNQNPAPTQSTVTAAVGGDSSGETVVVVVQAPPAPAEAAAPAAPTPPAAPPTLAEVVAKTDLPASIAMALIKRGAASPAAEEQIAAARAINDICTAARLPDVAAGYVERGVALETVRAELASAVASSGPEISTALPAQGGTQGGPVGPGLWAATIKRFGGKS